MGSDVEDRQLLKRTRDLYALRDRGEQAEAIRRARLLLDEKKGDFDVDSLMAAVLIDAGGDAGEADAVQQGIELIERLLPQDVAQEDKTLSTGLRYNLANGHAALYKQARKRGDWDAAHEALAREKELLQHVLLRRKHLDAELVPRALTNYANLLDNLSRTFEAIDVYLECLRIRPDHAVARGNCGVAVHWITPLIPKNRPHNLYAALELLDQAVKDQGIAKEEAGVVAAVGLQDSLRSLRETIGATYSDGQTTLLDWAKPRQEAHGTPCAEPLMRAARADRLLLTHNLFPLESEEECRDDLYFHSLTTPIGEDGTDRFRKLAHALNQMKEDYSTARHLYYIATQEADGLSSISSRTLFGDTFDYATFGLRTGILKTAFRIGIDCLDKIAVFLNDFLELGLDDNRVTFQNIWHKNERLAELTQGNLFLAALRDLKTDWVLQVYPGPLRGARNAATHRKLILYAETTPDRSDPTRWSVYEFENLTKTGLRTIKTAIQTLVVVVAVEEQKKADEAQGLLGPSPFSLQPGLEDRF